MTEANRTDSPNAGRRPEPGRLPAWGEHRCLIYERREEALEIATKFLSEGLPRGERSAYLCDDNSQEQVVRSLTAAGVDVAREHARGALVVTDAAELRKLRPFDPVRLCEHLRGLTNDAIASDFAGLRLVVEMTWTQSEEINPEQLTAYEAMANAAVFARGPVAAICMYNRTRFTEEVLAELAASHPMGLIDLTSPVASHSDRPSFEAGIEAQLETVSARRLAFLAEAGRILTSSLDCDATLRSVARMSVPIMADYCIVDLVQSDGSIRRVTTAHRDPAKEALTAELRRFPPDPRFSGGVPRVLRTGEPEIATRIDEEGLAGATHDAEHLQIVRRLEPSSYMIVPLLARNHVLGTLTFIYSDPSRTYGPEDLLIGGELAGHAALAIENARLYEASQAEIAESQRAQEELDRKQSFLRLMLDITTAANEAQNLTDALQIALERVRSHTGWPVGHAYLANASGTLEATGLWSTDDTERFRTLRDLMRSVSLPPGVGLPGRVVTTGRAAAVPELAKDPGFLRTPLAREVGVRAAFAFPVLVGAEVVAVLEFFSGRAVTPDAGFLEVMEYVGTQLGRVVERERAELALREGEGRFRELAENVREVFWVSRPDYSQVLYVSPAFERIWGSPVADLYREPGRWIEAVHPEDLGRVRSLLEAPIGAELEVEFRIVRPDGTTRWIYARGVPIRREDGELLRVVGIAEDITEDKRADDALRESEEHWRLLFERSPLPRWVLDEDTLDLIDVNAATVRDYGYPRDEFRSMRFTDLSPPAEVEALEDALRRTEQADGGELGEFRHRLRSGEIISVVLSTQKVTLAGRNARLVVGLDVTERRRIEVERSNLLAKEQEARERAEEAVRVRDDVLRMVSHDLRNPVHTIKLSSSLLSEVPLSESASQEQVEVIRRTADHMQRLVQGLLDLKRIEAGHGIPVEPKPTEVATLLSEGHSLFRPQAEAKQVSVEYDVAEGLPMVDADPERILQVLWNLTGNAIKFTPSGGLVRVTAEEREGEVLFAVSDSGPGIPQNEMEKLFDPFWQAKRTARLGTGLGLPISKALVEAHGGRIWAESVLGEGTTFLFTLPT